MRTTTAIAAIALALALAGCSAASPEATTPTTAATTTPTTAPTTTPVAGVGNLADPLCAAAQDSIDTANELATKTSDLTNMLQDSDFLASDDASALNAWGTAMLTLTAKTQAFYELGVGETAGDDVNADFATLTDFVSSYTVPLAQAAADATTPSAFITALQDQFSDADAQGAAAAAPSAAQNVAAYLGERCGITD